MVASADVLILDNKKVDKPLRVYNFSVENTPSYFVGTGKLWVHNAACNPALLHPDIKNHLTKYDSSRFSQSKGVSGAHNIDEFNKAVTERKLDIVSTTNTSVDGITEIKYRVPKKDSAGNIIPGEFKATILTKTVYDPKKISDSDIFKKGKTAANIAFQDAPKTGSFQKTVVVDGISFRVYVRDGVVTNFHPN